MKTFMLLTMLLGLSYSASAEDLGRGFRCSLTYQSEGAFNTAEYGESAWLGDGASLKDGMNVHSLTVKKIEKRSAIYWRVEVRNGNNSVFLVETPDFKGFKVTIPVDVTAPGSEDPPTFKYLSASCDPTYFAG